MRKIGIWTEVLVGRGKREGGRVEDESKQEYGHGAVCQHGDGDVDGAEVWAGDDEDQDDYDDGDDDEDEEE